MEIPQSHKILLSLFTILSLLSRFSSTSYELPDRYFINCGSSSNFTLNGIGKTFTGDQNPAREYVLSSSHGSSHSIEDPFSQADNPLYQSARKFTKPSFYELPLNVSGIYILRFHFLLLPFIEINLSDALFDVSASEFLLLSNFTGSGNHQTPIQDFLLQLPRGKLKIHFVPYNKKKSFAFVNAIEVFLAPSGFIPDSATHITHDSTSDHKFEDVLKTPLHAVHRINVGGDKITPENDTMLRYWVPDDDYLLNNHSVNNSEHYGGTPKYQSGKATKYYAPDYVYTTAKQSLTNVTWSFDVQKSRNHLVRLHFCDIVSNTTNEFNYFNLYIYRNFREVISSHNVTQTQLAPVPYYIDFVVYSDDSGFMDISIGPNSGSEDKTAFLNGVEIMEVSVLGKSGQEGDDTTRKQLLIIVGSSVGGGVFLLIILIMIVVCLRKKKWKAVESFDWPLVPLNGGSSYSRTTVRTSVGSTIAELNLGLKVPLSEILFATKKFNPKMMIGGGGFGKVYKGELRNGTKVAVKRSEPGLDQGLPEFQSEIMVLSKIRHQHLVSLIGYCDERNEMILVYEFMENGTLRDHLYGEECKRSRPSWEQRLRICIGAAKGIHYLHTGSSGTIIHRDIKSTNILLDENYVAKVADFGLSRSGPLDQTHVSTEVKGSFGYLDPEYFRCLQLTQKSDVYSFGVVLLEVLCARPVIDHSLPKEQVNLADWGMVCLRKGELSVDPVLEGDINPSSLRKFGETVDKCLEEFGADRPNMVDVLWDLEYCLQLQNSAAPRQAYEDSNNQASCSWGLPLNVVQRLPSNSIAGDDEEEETVHSFAGASQVNGNQVFSLLNLNEAR